MNISINWQRLMRALGLFGLLVIIYFLTYTGEPISDDELIMFDGAHSFLHGRGLELAYTNPLRPYHVPHGMAPVISLDTEPMQAYLTAPLIWIAQRMPGIGVLQTAWLLNIFITALTGAVLFYYGVLLGYSERAALITALLFGIATYAWIYTKFFFREPAFTLFVLTCAYCLERWRQGIEHQRFYIVWPVMAVLALGAAILTKEAAFVTIPFLLLILIPGGLRRVLNWRVMAALAVVIAAAVGFFLLLQETSARGNIADRLARLNWSYLGEAIAGYLFSPGFSIWAFSPVLFIGLIGVYWLWRQKRLRYVLVPLTFLLSVVIGYGLSQSQNWYGGAGWGPRYLLPVTPFLALWLLPVAERIIKRELPAWLQAAMIGIGAFGIFLQMLAAFGSTMEFGTYLYDEADRLNRTIVAWQDGVWNPLYNPFFIIAHQITTPSPSAWILNGAPLLLLPIALTASLMLYLATRPTISRQRAVLATVAAIAGLAVTLFVSLRTYYRDPRFKGGEEKLWEASDKLNREVQPGDAVILNDGFYARFFMNTYKRAEPIYVMPDAPGERLGFSDAPEIVTNDPELRAHPYTAVLLSRLEPISSRWWFVTEFSPYAEGRFRPTEHYLARHYFPIDEPFSDFSVRLLRFAPISAPPDRVPPFPANPVNANFGIGTLIGYDLPAGNTFAPGTMLPVSVLWRHDSWPDDLERIDYSVNVVLINQAGAAVAQYNGTGSPMAGFAPISQWVEGAYYRDNRAIMLPADLPAGDYQLWLLVFDWGKNVNLPVRNAVPDSPADHVVLTTITVAPR